MDLASIVPLGIFVVSGSALVTYTVAVSRQRVWLQRRKSEELFRTAEETYLNLYDYFRPHYEMRRASVKPNVSCDIAEVKHHIVDMKTLVGVYFPSLGRTLSGCVSATATAFDMLRLAEAADENNRERALDALADAVNSLGESFDRFKISIPA